MSLSGSSRDVLLERLAEEFVERHRRGERPAVSEYSERYPDLIKDINDLFPDLIQIEHLKPAVGDLTGPDLGTAPSVTSHPERLGEFRILHEVGRGGMGVVYEAEQESLGRHVALKVLPAHALLHSTYLERFRREAKAAARLHHTNIVPVFGVGEADGVPYYAMQFIRGEPLDKVLDDLRRFRQGNNSAFPKEGSGAHHLISYRSHRSTAIEASPTRTDPSPSSTLSNSEPSSEYHRSVAHLGVQVAEALAHAHAQGILHRDIKPSNLLLDGQGRVWITDFGLAKAEGSDELTQTGDIVGTLRYMAPERFDGCSLPQSDVYALGLTLYEMLTLRAAFEDSNKGRLIDKVLHEPPTPPRKVDPKVPRDLETIVLKCVAKDVAERYAGAEAVAEELRRFLADRPIKARRTSTTERVWLWCRRNPLVAGLSATVLLLLTVTAVGGVFMTLRLNDSLTKVQEEERKGKRKLFQSLLSDADATRMSRRPGQRFNSLRRIREALEVGYEIGLSAEDKLKLRNIAIAALCLPDVEPAGFGETEADLLPPEWLVRESASYNRVKKALERVPKPYYSVHGNSWFSPNGRYFVLGTAFHVNMDWPVRVWRVEGDTMEPVLEEPHRVYEEAVAFRADEKQLALGHTDGTVGLHDLETRKRVGTLRPGTGPVFTLVYHPRLPRLAVASGSQATVWDLPTGRILQRLGHPATVVSLAWHPRGHRLVTGCEDRLIRLWDIETGHQVTAPWQGHRIDGIRVAFNNAGDRVASNDWHRVLRLWDAATGQLLLSKPGYAPCSFGTEDRLLWPRDATASREGLRVASGEELLALQRPTPQGGQSVLCASLHPDGRLLALVTQDAFSLYDLHRGEEVGSVRGFFSRRHGVRFDRSGALWTAGSAGLLRWPVQATETMPPKIRVGPPEWVSDVIQHEHDRWDVSANGEVAAVPMLDKGATVVHRGSARRTIRLGPLQDVRYVFVSPDGQWIVTATHWVGEWGRVWEAATGRLVARLFRPEVEGCSGFSLDSRWLYLSGKENLRLDMTSLAATPPPDLDSPDKPPTWPEQWRTEPIRWVGTFFTDDGLRAFADNEGSIPLRRPGSDEEVARLSSPEMGRIQPESFNSDGSLLLARGEESGTIYVYDMIRLRAQLAELGLDWDDVEPLPQRSKDLSRGRAESVGVELIEAESSGSAEKMAVAERRRAAVRISFNPFDGEAHLRLGRSLAVTGKYNEAYAHLTAGIAFCPDLEEALALRARISQRLKRWDDAAADADCYLAKTPFDYSIRWLRARSNRARNRYEDAIADYTALHTLYPGSAAICDERAECYEALGKTDLARADREASKKLGGQGGRLLNNEAWKLVTGPVGARDPAKALERIRKALDLEPENALYLNTLGVVQYRNGLFREAVESLQKSLAASAGESDAFDLFFLSMCHAKLGDAAKAQDHYDRAVKWTKAQKGLSAKWAEELQAFRLEAEQELARK